MWSLPAKVGVAEVRRPSTWLVVKTGRGQRSLHPALGRGWGINSMWIKAKKSPGYGMQIHIMQIHVAESDVCVQTRVVRLCIGAPVYIFVLCRRCVQICEMWEASEMCVCLLVRWCVIPLCAMFELCLCSLFFKKKKKQTVKGKLPFLCTFLSGHLTVSFLVSFVAFVTVALLVKRRRGSLQRFLSHGLLYGTSRL